MSGETANIFTNTNTLPKYVVDETLKRARTEDGSAIRVAVTSDATDLSPITNALGTQQDPAETPTVIGLLKNLVAKGGGGGGGSSTYPVMKTQLNYISFTMTTAPPFTKKLSTCLSVWNDENTSATIPDWAKGMLIFRPGFGGWCLVHDRSGDGYGKFSYTMGSPTDGTLTLESFSLTISPVDTNDWNIIVDDYSASNYYDLTDSTNNSYDALFKQYGYFWAYVIFFDPDPLDISGGGGGGGGGEAISTYSLTLNNVTVTDITAPTETPPSSDDQTLVTVSYRRNLPVQLTNDLVNNQSTSVAKEGSINLETDFSITLPEWTELIKLGITNSGGYMDYITMAADVNKSYVSVTGAGNIDVYSYNASTKVFTFVSGGGDSIRILSLRVEGKTTI